MRPVLWARLVRLGVRGEVDSASGVPTDSGIATSSSSYDLDRRSLNKVGPGVVVRCRVAGRGASCSANNRANEPGWENG